VKIVYALPFEPVVQSRSVIANDHYQSIGIVCLSVIRGRSTSRA